MVVVEKEVLINTEVGGFHLPVEIGEWLREHKQWDLKVIKTDEDWRKHQHEHVYPIYIDQRYSSGSTYTSPDADEVEARVHPDIIEAVRAIKKKYKTLLAKEWYEISNGSKQEQDLYRDLHWLRKIAIKRVRIDLTIEHLHAGIEEVSVAIKDDWS